MASVVKVIEIIAESPESWEAATKTAVAEAAKSVRNIQNVYIESMKAIVEGSLIVRYRVDTKITFIVEH
jgi:flavin-binding protein dodecin